MCSSLTHLPSRSSSLAWCLCVRLVLRCVLYLLFIFVVFFFFFVCIAAHHIQWLLVWLVAIMKNWRRSGGWFPAKIPWNFVRFSMCDTIFDNVVFTRGFQLTMILVFFFIFFFYLHSIYFTLYMVFMCKFCLFVYIFSCFMYILDRSFILTVRLANVSIVLRFYFTVFCIICMCFTYWF